MNAYKVLLVKAKSPDFRTFVFFIADRHGGNREDRRRNGPEAGFQV